MSLILCADITRFEHKKMNEAWNKIKLVFQTIRELRDNNRIDDFDDSINWLNNINVNRKLTVMKCSSDQVYQ